MEEMAFSNQFLYCSFEAGLVYNRVILHIISRVVL